MVSGSGLHDPTGWWLIMITQFVLLQIYEDHPLLSITAYAYNTCEVSDNYSLPSDAGLLENDTTAEEDKVLNQPNTALMSTVHMFGTLFLAMFLKNFRNSKFLGRTARRALGDFGVPIAIATMTLIDEFAVKDTYTEVIRKVFL